MKVRKSVFICSSVLVGLFIGINNTNEVKAADGVNANTGSDKTVKSNESVTTSDKPNSPLQLSKEDVKDNDVTNRVQSVEAANNQKQSDNAAPASEELATEQDTTKVVVHYNGDGDKWKPYVWGVKPGADGKQYDWSGKDDNGYYANIDVPGNQESVGILIKGATDWSKDGSGADRHQDVDSGGKAEVFYKTGSDENQNVVPKYHNAKINLHYEGQDHPDITYWTDTDTTKKTISLTAKDVDLSEGTINFDEKGTTFSKIFVQPVGGVTASFRPIADNTNTDIYLLSGDSQAYYTQSFAKESETITSALVPDLNTLNIKTGKKMTADQAKEKLSFSDGITIKNIQAVSPDTNGMATNFVITTNQDIDILNNNRIIINGHAKALDIGPYVRSQAFDDKYYYSGDDLGATYHESDTAIKLWAPTANRVVLNLYNSVDNSATPTKTVELVRGDKGTWATDLIGNYKGWAYDYALSFGDGTTNVTNDPYSKAVTINGIRSVIEDVNNIKPEDFNRMPAFKNPTDAIIYETSIRDFTSDPNSGIKDRGKFLGMIESGKTSTGQETGLAYLKSLGITHVQIMPSFDFASVDETKNVDNQYNWGYDPQNYDVPEGSYSTDPTNPTNRIMEMKEMINGLHKAGIRVIMDVVYNHVYNPKDQALGLTVPGYYFRYDENNNPTSASGCGNDVATTRKMTRKYIVDSVKYWATNYNIDGFRFDIMSLLDTDTMNDVRKALDEIDPGIITYGEGWDMNSYTKDVGTSQPNAGKVPDIGFFSDDMRNSVKGEEGNSGSWGLVLGNGQELNYKTNVSRFWDSMFGGQWLDKDAWEPHPYVKPSQVINYVACHDGHTLYDYLKSKLPNASEAEIIKRVNLANSMVMFAEGVPFYHSGQEAMRSKQGNENSYDAPISINQIDWDQIAKNNSTVEYFKKIAKLRSQLNVLHLNNYYEINKDMKGISNGYEVPGVFAFEYNENGKKFIILFNVKNENVEWNKNDFSNSKKLLDSDGNVVLGKTTQLAPLSTLVVDESGTMQLPDTPDKPDQPITPGKPDQPTTPGKPDQPTTPGKSDQPTVPVQPDAPMAPNNSNSAESQTSNTVNLSTDNSKDLSTKVTQDQNNVKVLSKVLQRNAVIYDSLGNKVKKNGKVSSYKAKHKLTILDNGKVYKIKGINYYRVGKNAYVKAINFVKKGISKKVKLYKNSYIYSRQGKIAKKHIVLKKGTYLKVYGKYQINGQSYYRIGKNAFIKVTNTIKK